MPLSITVEDGTGVANASSYATVAAMRAYNVQRGVALPSADDDVIVLSTVAMDVLASYGPRWKGNRALPLIQLLDWPRQCVKLYGQDVPITTIPLPVIAAQCYLVGVAMTVDLLPVIDQRQTVKEKIGPIETDYASAYGVLLRPIIPNLEALLQPFLNAGVGGITSVRV